MMRNRTTVPRIVQRNGEDRLLILPGEEQESSTAGGRPIGPEYWSKEEKLAFMDMHRIRVSVLSLANPWLEFLDAKEAPPAAAALNEDLEKHCEDSGGRFYGFGVLPTANVTESVREVERISKLPHLRGVIIGTHGLGKGLDDPALLPVWEAIEHHQQMVFIHPHYGVGTEHYSGYSHSLFLALGFPFETTTAVARIVLSGLLDKCPNLKLLLAHSGGALPQLAGRLDSCVHHDPEVASKLKKTPSEYLSQLYYDAVVYQESGLRSAIALAGKDNIMFGTDNPFFRPVEMDKPWYSVTTNYDAIARLDNSTQVKIRRGNAARVLNIDF
eukprot:GILJ01002167.1.p1 GENE.GILJ01002167.1~~GILJ01002167.1.p1  ORF type:complete len:381 (+),score=44.77 GILJ01002167.1:160-1143(+)